MIEYDSMIFNDIQCLKIDMRTSLNCLKHQSFVSNDGLTELFLDVFISPLHGS